MTCFFTKIVSHIRDKHKQHESNPFLLQNEPTHPFDLLFAKIAWCGSQKVNEVNLIHFVSVASPPTSMTFFLQKLHGPCESNVNEINSIFLCKRIKPTLPYDLFLTKIA